MKWNKKNLDQNKENESEIFDKELKELKIESKFEKQLQKSEEYLKSYTQNNWIKKDDDDEDMIDYVWEFKPEIKKPDDNKKN
uniref:Uncharacterized protein n=1 Tax=uncultured delta proteobacterium HF0130_20J24 TaxID=710829 RepID=E0XXS2_9DELT|nr:hypothetical protein [uncultured delta proteobacterium HF0130_20J24]